MDVLRSLRAMGYRPTRLNRSPRRLSFEPLEERQLLATCHVTRLGDQGFRGDLRSCITSVNSAPGPDVILFGVNGTIKLQSALPKLTSDIDIQGPGSDLLTIDAQQKARVFYVEEGATVEISGLKLTGGRDNDGGGVLNEGRLTLRDCLISGNTVSTTGGARRGGGIYNGGILWLLQSSVSANSFGGISPLGGGIFNAGTLIAEDSLIANNFIGGGFSSNPEGAGIYNAGKATIVRSTISENQGNIVTWATFSGSGGGVYNAGVLLVDSSLIANNQISGDYWAFGGGIYNTGTATVVNTSVYNNLAFGRGDGVGEARGGGIYNQEGWTLTLSHSTIARNRTGRLHHYVTAFGGGISVEPNGTLYIDHTIVAGNDALDGGADTYGTLASSGHNLFGGTSGGSGYAPTDLLDINPQLGPLANNGGPTMTMRLGPDSPASDAGDPNLADPPQWDQRGPGFARIANGRVDIGAFEVQASPMPAIGRGSVDLAVLITAENDDITFALTLAPVFPLGGVSDAYTRTKGSPAHRTT